MSAHDDDLARLRAERAALTAWLAEHGIALERLPGRSAAVRRRHRAAAEAWLARRPPRPGRQEEGRGAVTDAPRTRPERVGRGGTGGGAMPKRTQAWTADEVVAAFQRFYRATGRWPLAVDCCSANGLPTYGAVERLFETLAEARRQAGMPGGGEERYGPREAHLFRRPEVHTSE
jgi:hypothetical protein